MARPAPSSPLLGGSRRSTSQVAAALLVIALGLCAAVVLLNSVSLKRSELIQMGIGAEDENDLMLKNALGDEEGDVTAEVEEMTEEEVEAAEEATQEGVDEEIGEALEAGEAAGKEGYEADLAKYKAQEADMGHTGWAQSWARPMREAGLSEMGVAGRHQAAMQQLAMQHKPQQEVLVPVVFKGPRVY